MKPIMIVEAAPKGSSSKLMLSDAPEPGAPPTRTPVRVGPGHRIAKPGAGHGVGWRQGVPRHLGGQGAAPAFGRVAQVTLEARLDGLCELACELADPDLSATPRPRNA